MDSNTKILFIEEWVKPCFNLCYEAHHILSHTDYDNTVEAETTPWATQCVFMVLLQFSFMIQQEETMILQRHNLHDPGRKRVFEALMCKGGRYSHEVR